MSCGGCGPGYATPRLENKVILFDVNPIINPLLIQPFVLTLLICDGREP